MEITIRAAEAAGLPDQERETLKHLLRIYQRHASKNAEKRKYYEGHITVGDVNLGLALPKDIQGLQIGCAWGEKTVDVLAARSMFDGYVGENGEAVELMAKISAANQFRPAYERAVRDELKYGCTFATLSRDDVSGCRIRFHSPETGAAEWDGLKGRIGAGFVISGVTEKEDGTQAAAELQLHTDTAVWVIRRFDDNDWRAEAFPHMMGRPLMEPLVWNATAAKPLGRSRLKYPIRKLIDGYVRTVANATIGLEFSTAPQKYLLGITDEQYDAVINQKFRTYVGSMIASTVNPETGEKPTFGQLAQGNIEPHVQMLRMLSTQFSAATGLTVTDVGVVNDANPTSSDAILAQSQTLILTAEQLNQGNAGALYAIAQMAMAIALNVAPDQLADELKRIVPHFKNPAMPSVSVTADAAVKIANVRQGFAETDVFLEMLGFDQADIRRIRAQEARARGDELLNELEL